MANKVVITKTEKLFKKLRFKTQKIDECVYIIDANGEIVAKFDSENEVFLVNNGKAEVSTHTVVLPELEDEYITLTQFLDKYDPIDERICSIDFGKLHKNIMRVILGKHTDWYFFSNCYNKGTQ